jgi:ATP-binding cassette subfamily B protein
MTQGHASGKALFWRLLLQARPYWPHLGGLLALSLLAPGLRLLAPVPLKFAVDGVIGGQPPAFLEALSGPALLGLAAGLLVLVTLLSLLVGLAASVLGAYVGEQLVRSFRAALFRHAQRLSLTYHDANGTADSTYRIQYDAPAIQWVVVEGAAPLLAALFTLVVMVAVVAIIDWQLALVALMAAPVLFALSHFYGRRLRKQAKEVAEVESSAMAVVQEVLGAIRVVKAFGQEDREHARFVDRSQQSLGARLQMAFFTGLLSLLVGLAVAGGTAAVLYVGATHVLDEQLSLGDLLVVMAYLAQLYGPMETLSKKVADLQGSLVCAERAFSLLDQSPDVAERSGARVLDRATGTVEFQDVWFAYPDNPPVLRDINFRVRTGARVGIEGRTGAGKTTLISLLARFYDPSEGRVLLDGMDLRDLDLAGLRNQIALVLQEPVLFSASIAENIAYARPWATQEEIEDAARAANAHDFIMATPGGYETLVGERGMRLSGGERQRISLARAFLKDAPILVLDEPTSSVDVNTEGLIMDALERLMMGRTTFIIAHRLSTLEGCDVRLRLEAGALTVGPSQRLQPAGS